MTMTTEAGDVHLVGRRAAPARLVMLLDRDGVINRRLPGGVRTEGELEILPRALEAFACLKQADATVAIVSNQANIFRGLLAAEQLARLHQVLLGEVARAGGRVDAVYHCPHAAEGGCGCRKPEPGMLLRAARELDFDIASAWMVGDAPSDVEAARRAGCRSILVGGAAAGWPADEARPAAFATDLFDAVRLAIAEHRAASSVVRDEDGAAVVVLRGYGQRRRDDARSAADPVISSPGPHAADIDHEIAIT